MSDPTIPLSVLTKFHKDVIVPDIRRIVEESEGRLRNEMQGFHDSILKRLGDLETESQAIKTGLKRLEERFELVEASLGKVEERLGAVEADLRQLEERLAGVEKRLDEIAEPQPTLRADVLDLKASVQRLQARIDALERREDRS
jgi:chromosome segregation ATPase